MIYREKININLTYNQRGFLRFGVTFYIAAKLHLFEIVLQNIENTIIEENLLS